jgi:hypothetical protein
MTSQWGLGGQYGTPASSWLTDTAGGASTFAGDPRGLWQAGRIGQMSDTQLANPAFRNQVMTGFTPMLGAYNLAGAPGTFANWMSSGVPDTGVGQYGTPGYGGAPTGTADLSAQWANAVAASAAMPTFDIGDKEIENFRMMSLLQGENARRNALSMAGAYMGGGIGYGAQAQQAALGNMYDVYAAKQAGQGDVSGTFLSWLNSRMNPGAG